MQLPVVTPRQLVSYTASPRVATLPAVDPVEQSAITLFQEVQQAAKKLEETNQLLEDLKGRFASQKATDVSISALQQRVLKYVAWYREEKLTDTVRHKMAQEGSERLQRGLAFEDELDELQADRVKLNALIVQLKGTSLFRGIKEQVTASVSSHKTPKQLYLELAQKILGYELKKIEPSTNQQLLTLLDEKQKKVCTELESLKKEAVYIVARGEWDMAQSKQLETAQRSILAQALNDRLEHEMGKLKKRTSRFLDAEKKYEEALVELAKKYQLLKVLPEAKQEDAVRLQVIDRLFAQYCRTPCTDFRALLSDSCPDDEPYLAHFLATRRFPPIPLVNVQAVECQRIFAQMAVRSTQSDMAALRPLPFGSSQVYACYWQERPWAVFKPTDGQPSMSFCKPGKQEALPLHFPPNEATQREWAAWSLIQPYFLSSIVALQHSNLCYQRASGETVSPFPKEGLLTEFIDAVSADQLLQTKMCQRAEERGKTEAEKQRIATKYDEIRALATRLGLSEQTDHIYKSPLWKRVGEQRLLQMAIEQVSLVNCDLNESNILLSKLGEMMVIDFGRSLPNDYPPEVWRFAFFDPENAPDNPLSKPFPFPIASDTVKQTRQHLLKLFPTLSQRAIDIFTAHNLFLHVAEQQKQTVHAAVEAFVTVEERTHSDCQIETNLITHLYLQAHWKIHHNSAVLRMLKPEVKKLTRTTGLMGATMLRPLDLTHWDEALWNQFIVECQNYFRK